MKNKIVPAPKQVSYEERKTPYDINYALSWSILAASSPGVVFCIHAPHTPPSEDVNEQEFAKVVARTSRCAYVLHWFENFPPEPNKDKQEHLAIYTW